jgi:hypothetical protein
MLNLKETYIIMIPLPPIRDKNKNPCPVCKSSNCFEHCNKCGTDIYFKKNDYGGRYRCMEVKTQDTHRCRGNAKSDPDFDVAAWLKEYAKYNESQKNYMCMECARAYNKLVYPLCPSCWKNECRECGNRQSWIINKDSMNCNVCGSMCDPVHVWNAYNRLYGKPNLS